MSRDLHETSEHLWIPILAPSIWAVHWRRHRWQLPTDTHDDDTPEDRRHFMAWTTMLLAGLSLGATAFVALAAILVGGCA